MTCISSILRSSTGILLASSSRCHPLVYLSWQFDISQQKHSVAFIGSWPTSSASSLLSVSPRSSVSKCIMSRRSSRVAASSANNIQTKLNENEKVDPEDLDDSNKSNGRVTKKRKVGEAKGKKKTVPAKEASLETTKIEAVSASEAHLTKTNSTIEPSTSTNIQGSEISVEKDANPPKMKSKVFDHQRWTERTPIIRHWNPQTAPNYTFTVISWNIAGLRTFIKKNPDALPDLAKNYDADVICLQETKLQDANLVDPKLKLKEYFDEKMMGYDCHFNCSFEKKGYSGTAMFIKKYSCADNVGKEGSKKGKKQATLGSFLKAKDAGSDDSPPTNREVESSREIPISSLHPVTVSKQLGFPAHDGEGRIIIAEFPLFYLTNVYVPNSGQNLERLAYRTEQWDKDFLTRMQQLETDGKKPVIWFGDLNVAFDENDTWNEGAKHLAKSAGTTPEERESFLTQLGSGFVDVFRQLHPDGKGHYTYWSQRAGNREPNKGLRLDYFVCSKDLIVAGGSKKAIVRDSYMIHDQMGSDHCPLVLDIEVQE